MNACASYSLGTLLEIAREQAARDDDPWDALVTTLAQGAEIMAADRAMGQLMAEVPGPITPDLETLRGLNEAMTLLLDRAHGAGVLREGVVLDDIPMLMCGIAMATMKPHEKADAWRRHLAIVIDGLRASCASG